MEASEGSVKKKKTKIDLKQQHLVAILVGLAIVMVGLIVGIVVVSLNNTGSDVAVDEEVNDVVGEPEVSEDEVQKEKQLRELRKSVKEQVSELVNAPSVNVAAINKLYEDAINTSISFDRKDYAILFFNDRKEAFLSRSMRREALDSMLTFDFDMFSAPDRYRLYTAVIDLAKDVGDSQVVSKYEELRSAVEEAYQEDYEATKKAAEKAEAEFEEAKKTDEAILREKGDPYVGDDKEDEE